MTDPKVRAALDILAVLFGPSHSTDPKPPVRLLRQHGRAQPAPRQHRRLGDRLRVLRDEHRPEVRPLPRGLRLRQAGLRPGREARVPGLQVEAVPHLRGLHRTVVEAPPHGPRLPRRRVPDGRRDGRPDVRLLLAATTSSSTGSCSARRWATCTRSPSGATSSPTRPTSTPPARSSSTSSSTSSRCAGWRSDALREVRPDFDEQRSTRRWTRIRGPSSAAGTSSCAWRRATSSAITSGRWPRACEPASSSGRAWRTSRKPEFWYFFALTLAAMHGKAAPAERARTVEMLAAHERKLAEWSAECP